MGVIAWLFRTLFASIFGFLAGAIFGVTLVLGLFLIWSGQRASPAPKSDDASFPSVGVSKHLKDRLPHTVLPARNLIVAPASVPSLLGRASGLLLRVRVIEGKELLPVDAARTRLNSMVVIRFLGQTAKTKLVKRSLSPRWDFAAHLPAGEASAVEGAMLEFELCSTSRALGRASLRLAGLVRGREVATWLPLTGLAQTDYGLVRAKGSISVAVELVDAQSGSTPLLMPSSPFSTSVNSSTPIPSALTASTSSVSSLSSTASLRSSHGSLRSSTSSLRDSGDTDRERAAEARREQMLSITVHERAKEAARALAKLPAAVREQGERVNAGWVQVKSKDWVEMWCVLERRGVLRLQADETPENLAALISLAECDLRRKKKGIAMEVRQRSRKNFIELYATSLDRPHDHARKPFTPSRSIYKIAIRVKDEAELEKWMRDITAVIPNAQSSAITATPDDAPAAGSADVSALQKQVAEEEKKLELGDESSGSVISPAVGAGMVQALEVLRETKPIEARWATALFGRVFRELNGSKIFLAGISRQIRRALKNIHHELIGPIVLQQLELGKQFLSVNKVRCAGNIGGRTNEMLLELEVDYPGGFAISLSTEIYINIPRPRAATIPVQLHVSLNYLAAKLCLYAPASLTERYELFFHGPPTFMPNVRVEVGDKQRQLLVGTLRNYVYAAVNKALANVLVSPNSVGFFLPYPGKEATAKLNVRSKRVASGSSNNGGPSPSSSGSSLTPSSSSSSIPAARSGSGIRRDSSASSNPPSSPSAGDAPPPFLTKRTPTQLAMKIGPSKNPDEKPETHAKKYLVARYFDELLNRAEYTAVSELFTEACIVHGSTAQLDQDIIGHAALLDSLQDLHRALPGALFLLDDVAVDGDYVYTRWRARGTVMFAPFPARPGLRDSAVDGELLLSGFSIHRVGHGNQRIQEQWHFWAAPSLQVLLA